MDMTEMCRNLIKLTDEKKAIEDILSEKSAEVESAKYKILNHMKESGTQSIKNDFGTFSAKIQKNVAQPASREDKELLFKYLEDQGIYWEYVSVHSAKLSSWAKAEIEAKESQGILGWVPPGLAAAKEVFTLSVRKK